MAQVVFDLAIAGNDPVELLHLASGDPAASTYDTATITLTNLTVTQVALNQAILDLAAGIPSAVKTSITNSNIEDGVSPTTVALAILGDANAIASLQAMVGQTATTQAATLPATPPTGGGGGSGIQNNFTAVVAPSTAADSTLGYVIGSQWLNTTTKLLYTCISATVGLGQWVLITNQVIVNTITASVVLAAAAAQHVRADATLAAIAVTLPDASLMVGEAITINKIDATANTVAITPFTGQLITGLVALPPLHVQYTSLSLRSFGIGWDII